MKRFEIDVQQTTYDVWTVLAESKEAIERGEFDLIDVDNVDIINTIYHTISEVMEYEDLEYEDDDAN